MVQPSRRLGGASTDPNLTDGKLIKRLSNFAAVLGSVDNTCLKMLLHNVWISSACDWESFPISWQDVCRTALENPHRPDSGPKPEHLRRELSGEVAFWMLQEQRQQALERELREQWQEQAREEQREQQALEREQQALAYMKGEIKRFLLGGRRPGQ